MRWRARFCVRPSQPLRGRFDGTPRDCVAGVAPRVHNEDSRLASRVEVKVERDGVHFALRVTNETKKHIELLYPNGQTHEFVVVDSAGREIWRWSAARLFTQALQNKLLASGETMVKAERWEHHREHGKYTVIATLNCTNFPLQERADFVVP